MRRKIKQMMNKEEGFTLVELLAVIVILGIIVAIAIPSVGSVVERARGNAASAEEELVVDAARLYMVENSYDDLTTEGSDRAITVGELKRAGFLDTRNSELEDDSKVIISRDTSGEGEDEETVSYTYEFEE